MNWRSIETAPKDGTVFVCLSTHGISRCKWTSVDVDDWPGGRNYYWWHDPDENVWFEDGPHDAPTHWMPEPEHMAQEQPE